MTIKHSEMYYKKTINNISDFPQLLCSQRKSLKGKGFRPLFHIFTATIKTTSYIYIYIYAGVCLSSCLKTLLERGKFLKAFKKH